MYVFVATSNKENFQITKTFAMIAILQFFVDESGSEIDLRVKILCFGLNNISYGNAERELD